MSLNKRNSVRSTPKGSRVRQAFKSPFRGAGSPSVSSIQDGHNLNNIPSSKGTAAARYVNRESGNITEGYNERETAAETISHTPVKAQSEGAVGSCSTRQRDVIGKSPQLSISNRRKIVPRNFNAPFRSPSTNSLPQEYVSPEDRLAQLQEQEVELDEKITSLKNSGYKTEELQRHIEDLHRYNEIKDAAQLVMGRLAVLEGVTIKDMYQKYRVPATD